MAIPQLLHHGFPFIHRASIKLIDQTFSESLLKSRGVTNVLYKQIGKQLALCSVKVQTQPHMLLALASHLGKLRHAIYPSCKGGGTDL